MMLRWNDAGKYEEAAELKAAMDAAMARDCVAKVTWSGKADLDIAVKEPGGTVCSLQNPRTVGGGVVIGDAAGTEGDGIYTETYICPQGFNGDYELLIRPIWGDVSAGKVTVEIIAGKGTDDQRVIRQQIPIDDEPVLVRFELDQARREDALEEHLVANSIQRQVAANQAVLAQQLASTSDADIIERLAADRILAARGLLGSQFQQAVGFRPVVTPLPEGTNLTATGVISADRRYVRVTASPLFSGVTDVFSFNFVEGENTNIGTGGAGGGVGGGGVGGGGVGVGT